MKTNSIPQFSISDKSKIMTVIKIGTFLALLNETIINVAYAGLIMQMLSWRWIFIIIIPFTILSLIMGWVNLKNVTEKSDKKLDLLSLFLSIAGFGLLLYGINTLCSVKSSKTAGAAMLLIGIISLVIFVLRQLKINNPLLNIQIFKSPMFSTGMILITVTYMILFGNFVLMPMLIENALGYSAFHAGLAVLPGGILGALLPPIFGKVYDRHGPRVIVPPGFGILFMANLLISNLASSVSILITVLCYCLVMLGMDIMLTACQTNSLNQLPHENYAHGTAIMNTLMMIGSAFGSSIFIALMELKQNQCLQSHISQLQAASNGIHYSYLFISLFALIGFILSFFFKKK